MTAKPWYREPWPWLLMSGPAIVVVAGFWTLAVAISSNDGLVADDYYTEGLAINRTLHRDTTARALGVAATARFEMRTGEDRVRIRLDAGVKPPAALHLLLSHPTRSGMDQEIRLIQIAPGAWEGRMPALPHARWGLQLESPDAGWRLVGTWTEGEESAVLAVVPAMAAGPRP